MIEDIDGANPRQPSRYRAEEYDEATLRLMEFALGNVDRALLPPQIFDQQQKPEKANP